jgi:pre-mRNA-splicing factor SYF2
LTALCSRVFVDDAHAARRKYKKDVDKLKPDMEVYNRQKEAAMGLAPGTLSQNGSSEFSLTGFDPIQASGSQVMHFLSTLPLTNTQFELVQLVPTAHQQQVAAEGLYRDANSLLYADNKPSDDAIDRVIGKINSEYVFMTVCIPSPHLSIVYFVSIDKRRKFSRKRPNDDTGDITYINEKNRVFNKKVEPCFVFVRVNLIYLFPRLHVTSTNIPRKYVRALSVGRHYEAPFYFAWLIRATSSCITVYLSR